MEQQSTNDKENSSRSNNSTSPDELHGIIAYQDETIRFKISRIGLRNQSAHSVIESHYQISCELLNKKSKFPLMKHCLDSFTEAIQKLLETLKDQYGGRSVLIIELSLFPIYCTYLIFRDILICLEHESLTPGNEFISSISSL